MDTSSLAKYDVAPNFIFTNCNIKSKKINYPAKEAEAGIEGVVVITLNIDKFGNVNQTIVKKSLTPACDKEWLKGLETIKRCWLPTMKGNKFVDAEIDLNFTFKLE